MTDERLAALVNRYLDGQLTPAEKTELEDGLRRRRVALADQRRRDRTTLLNRRVATGAGSGGQGQMRAKWWLIAIVVCLLAPAAGTRGSETPQGPEGVREQAPLPAGPFQPTWESLCKYQVPDWFRDGKFGIFVHWGPQTLAGERGSARRHQVAVEGTGHGLSRREVRRGALGRDVPQGWSKIRGAGRGASRRLCPLRLEPDAVVVGEDGSPAGLREGTIGRGPPGRADLRGFVAHRGALVVLLRAAQEAAAPAQAGQPFVGEQPPQEWLDNWYARLVEIVEKYDPQVFWFDWSIEQPAYEPYLRKFAAYYYNRAAERNQGVVLNYKYEAFPTRAAVLDISVNTSRFRWEPEGVHPTPWQFDTWSAQGLWFWRPTMKLRPTAALIAELADVVSKNGNYLLNITPDPDGLLGPEQERAADRDRPVAGRQRRGDLRHAAVEGLRRRSHLGPRPIVQSHHAQDALHAAGHPLHHQRRHALRHRAGLARGPAGAHPLTGRRLAVYGTRDPDGPPAGLRCGRLLERHGVGAGGRIAGQVVW